MCVCVYVCVCVFVCVCVCMCVRARVYKKEERVGTWEQSSGYFFRNNKTVILKSHHLNKINKITNVLLFTCLLNIRMANTVLLRVNLGETEQFHE